jgi:hypothetical protein
MVPGLAFHVVSLFGGMMLFGLGQKAAKPAEETAH